MSYYIKLRDRISPYSVARSSYDTTMSSALAILILGHANIFGTLPNTLPTGSQSIQIPSITQSPNQLTPASDHLTRRSDYTYTAGIGAHKVHTKAASWNAAWRICRNEGGNLAIINSFAESKLIVKLLEAAGPPEGSNNPDHAHVGIHDLFERSQWVTLDGQFLTEAGFSEWQDGEPNGSQTDERCGSVYKDGRFNDNSCTVKICRFICELPYVEP